MAPLALGAIVLGGPVLFALVAAAAVLILFEWRTVTGAPAARPLFAAAAILVLGLLALAAFAAPPAFWPSALALLVASLLIEAVWRRGAPWLVLGVGWVALPCAGLLLLRQGEDGLWLVVWVFLAVAGCDIGGYFAGKSIGGPKLAPRISPNKTWAGLAGGMALAAAASALIATPSGLAPPALLAVLGAGLAVVAQGGDLAQSAVKRRFGVKDSGALLPGHGGLFDRVDGLLFAVPATLLISQASHARILS